MNDSFPGVGDPFHGAGESCRDDWERGCVVLPSHRVRRHVIIEPAASACCGVGYQWTGGGIGQITATAMRHNFHGMRGKGISLCMVFVLLAPATGPFYIDVTDTHLPGAARPEAGMDVESADIDNDGDLDIIIANEFEPNVILINDGTGKFTNESSARIPNNNNKRRDSEDIAIADFDGDKDLDIIFVSEDDHIHEYYLNDGTGRFTDVSSRLPQSTANAVVAADLNGDNAIDIIIGNAGQDLVLINDGTGKFEDQTFQRILPEDNVTQDVELVDVDRDGDLDMILGNEDGNKLMMNDGNGRFYDETQERLPISESMETRKVAFTDVDGDNDVDIFFANVQFLPGKNRQDRLYINDGTGHFTDRTAQQLPAMAENTIDAKFTDMDRDGDPDIILGSFPDRPVNVLLNNGSGTFSKADVSEILPEEILASALAIEVADFNKDNVADLYICDRGRTDWLLLHVGDGPSSVPGKDKSSLHPDLNIFPNFPNPFSRKTWIEYAVEEPATVDIRIYDIAGRYIETILNGHVMRGRNRVEWNTKGVPPGRYYCQIMANGITRSMPMVVEM